MIFVVDASVAIRWFTGGPSPQAEEVLETMVAAPGRFAVPELFLFECFSVLTRIAPNGREIFEDGIMPILDGGVFRAPLTTALARLAEGFVQRGLTGYDACYAALARELDGTWLTLDRKAARQVGAGGRVILLDAGERVGL
ncbi:type II toxin-antitoxin system VapC family toxin [Desulfolutivibrio sp.]|uniref:type II toxin-antitoxin system VapC family toxin n=1 Tax=Desulfolutivibrio sp. TaxID=2773296 RepID=UPI002F964AB3